MSESTTTCELFAGAPVDLEVCQDFPAYLLYATKGPRSPDNRGRATRRAIGHRAIPDWNGSPAKEPKRESDVPEQ
jgi:hypothetical protein